MPGGFQFKIKTFVVEIEECYIWIQYKNDSMKLISMLLLKFLRFFTAQYGERKRAAISKLRYFLTPSSRTHIV